MAFRKRNAAINRSIQSADCVGPGPTPISIPAVSPGTRPSPIDGRLTTSTGTASLDSLSGHAGLPVGNSVLIEESGTTDYGGVLLKYFAAEGIAQGQKVLLAGLGEQWGRELPGAVTSETEEGMRKGANKDDLEKLKIAWRYKSLGDFGASRRGVLIYGVLNTNLHFFNKSMLEC